MPEAQGSLLTAQRALVVTLLLLLPVPQASTQSHGRPDHHAAAAVRRERSATTTSSPPTRSSRSYWKKLDRESDRMQLVDIGRTEEGRDAVDGDHLGAGESSQQLDRYKDISRRLALAEGLTDDQARALAAEGKAVVWIDGGLHANEVLGAQQLIETVYQLVSRSDAETLRFLRDVIVLAVHANPDGHELVANWYMRERDPLRRTLDGRAARVPEVRRARQQPRLLHVHAGRDDQHEPRPLQGVVPADRLRPPPDRTRRAR